MAGRRGSTALGRELGEFLSALHAVDPAEAAARGAVDAATATAAKASFLDECRARVVPLLPQHAHQTALELLERVANTRTALVHADLGSEHVLVQDGIATGLAETYAVTPVLRQRARDWHRLAPWYGVHRGLLLDLPDDVETGLAEILTRL